MNSPRALILGATGAMSTYLIPLLLEQGYTVDGVTLEEVESSHPRLTYIKADATDWNFLTAQLQNQYDVIVDFLVYNTLESYIPYGERFLQSAGHYVFFSTYRVYAGDYPLTETSPRLLDVDKPADFVCEKEYSIYKAEEEDWLNRSPYKNYTILRPAITYSKRRLQLTTMEADAFVPRIRAGKTVLLPRSAMDKQATMSWAGDVAKMIAAVMRNKAAFGETYTVSTAEHMTWQEVADLYAEIGGMKYLVVDDEDFFTVWGGNNVYSRQQFYYDRCFNRVVDNSKILALCGLKQSDLMPLKKGIETELTQMDVATLPPIHGGVSARMDAYLQAHGLE